MPVLHVPVTNTLLTAAHFPGTVAHFPGTAAIQKNLGLCVVLKCFDLSSEGPGRL